jgi:RNA polymerase sigma-70 factor (ECF subfamily)
LRPAHDESSIQAALGGDRGSVALPLGHAHAKTDEPAAPPAVPSVDAFVREHHGFVWRVLRRAGLSPSDADDAAQQVFMIVTRRMGDIVVGAERAFLYRTAARVASSAHRSVARRRDTSGLDGDEAHHPAPLPDELLDQRRARELLDRILSELPAPLSAALILFDIEGLSKWEVAEALGVPEGTVASRVKRARAEIEARVFRLEARLRRGGAIE